MRHLAAALLMTVAVAATATASIQNTVRHNFNVAEGGKLVVDADIGDMTIVSGGSGVSVEVVRVAHTSNQSRANDMFRENNVKFSQSGNEVEISSRYGHGWTFFTWNNGLDVHYNIRVPQHFDLDLKTTGGDINVSSLNGKVEARTSGGDIKLATVSGPVRLRTSGGNIELAGTSGRADIHTSGGSIVIGETSGPIEAGTSGGSITIRHSGGEVKARTSGGGIHIEQAFGAVDASTSGGSIRASFATQPHSPSRLATSGGNVTVSIGPSVALDIDAHTSGGEVDTEVPVMMVGSHNENTLVGKINGGGPQLVLRTSGGGIRVKKL
jgi:hypothetical protein